MDVSPLNRLAIASQELELEHECKNHTTAAAAPLHSTLESQGANRRLEAQSYVLKSTGVLLSLVVAHGVAVLVFMELTRASLNVQFPDKVYQLQLERPEEHAVAYELSVLNRQMGGCCISKVTLPSPLPSVFGSIFQRAECFQKICSLECARYSCASTPLSSENAWVCMHSAIG